MLDRGSTITLIDGNLARMVGLKRTAIKMSLRGLYGGADRVTCERIGFAVSGSFGKQQIEHALIIPMLELPRQYLSEELVRRIKECHGLTIPPYRDAQLSIIIGQDNWPLMMCDETLRLENSALVLSHTCLGWSVHGYVEEK